MNGLFVTGTDTGVGKTILATSLVAALVERGYRVAVMKPCETGDGDDADRLIRAAGRPLDLDRVSPYRFALPVSPDEASRAANRHIDLRKIERCFAELTADSDLVVVEGAGGLLAPLTRTTQMADLIGRLKLPVLVAARASLGTVNQTLLTVEAARRRGLRLLGVVLIRSSEPLLPDEPSNASAIVHHGKVRYFGTIPFVAAARRGRPAFLGKLAERHLSPLLSLVTSRCKSAQRSHRAHRRRPSRQ